MRGARQITFLWYYCNALFLNLNCWLGNVFDASFVNIAEHFVEKSVIKTEHFSFFQGRGVQLNYLYIRFFLLSAIYNNNYNRYYFTLGFGDGKIYVTEMHNTLCISGIIYGIVKNFI